MPNDDSARATGGGLRRPRPWGDLQLPHQLLVGVGVKVHEVHLVPLDHHARVGGADAPRANHAHRLVLRLHTCTQHSAAPRPLHMRPAATQLSLSAVQGDAAPSPGSAGPHPGLTCSRLPMKSVGSQPLYLPARMNTSASATRRAAASVSAAASSAVVSVSTPARSAPSSPRPAVGAGCCRAASACLPAFGPPLSLPARGACLACCRRGCRAWWPRRP